MTHEPVTMNNPGCTPMTYRFTDFLYDALNRCVRSLSDLYLVEGLK
jgi:hypothetical protein